MCDKIHGLMYGEPVQGYVVPLRKKIMRPLQKSYISYRKKKTHKLLEQ